ncbi:MAG: hypothetical protein QOJ52_4283 [Acidimicrobiaceae bacterium]|nr:hypothetical protein [Acidimicrobiaceae bacterium]
MVFPSSASRIASHSMAQYSRVFDGRRWQTALSAVDAALNRRNAELASELARLRRASLPPTKAMVQRNEHIRARDRAGAAGRWRPPH